MAAVPLLFAVIFPVSLPSQVTAQVLMLPAAVTKSTAKCFQGICTALSRPLARSCCSSAVV